MINNKILRKQLMIELKALIWSITIIKFFWTDQIIKYLRVLKWKV